MLVGDCEQGRAGVGVAHQRQHMAGDLLGQRVVRAWQPLGFLVNIECLTDRRDLVVADPSPESRPGGIQRGEQPVTARSHRNGSHKRGAAQEIAARYSIPYCC